MKNANKNLKKKMRISKLIKLYTLVMLIAVSTVSSTNSIYKSDSSLRNSSLLVGCWVSPTVPEPIYPETNSIFGKNSDWEKDPYVKWEGSRTDCPLDGTEIKYILELYRNSELTDLKYQSKLVDNSKIHLTNIDDSTYYWRVKACDNYENCSKFSSPLRFIYDSKAPDIKIEFPEEWKEDGGTDLSGEISIKATIEDERVDHYSVVVLDGNGEKVVGLEDKEIKKSFENEKIFDWDTTESSNGKYTIKLRASDAAGNDSQESIVVKVENDKSETTDDVPATPTLEPSPELNTSSQDTPPPQPQIPDPTGNTSDAQ